MEANKRRCREIAIMLNYAASEGNLGDFYYKTPQKKYPLAKSNNNSPSRIIEWPNSVFSESKLNRKVKLFEESEPWYQNSGEYVREESQKRSSKAKQRLFASSSKDWFEHKHNEPGLNDCMARNDELIKELNLSDSKEIEEKKCLCGEDANKKKIDYFFRRTDAEELANRQRQESDNWFDYEANFNWPYHFPLKKEASEEVATMKQKYAGSEMKTILSPHS